jgi:site-specific DNA recombinase
MIATVSVTCYPYYMRAAIYVRQSLDKSGEALAVGRQLAECIELIERHGWTAGDVYTDNDTSASSGKARPAWARLLTDLEAGAHDVLVCWHTDRLYRRLRDLVDLVEIAERRALRIASVKASDIDLSTPAGRMLAGMLGSAARYEVEQKGARQVAANRARARSGVVLWTRRPFGFERQGRDLRIVDSEAREIRDAAKKVLNGASLSSIANDLNERGVPTSTGARWTVTGVKRTLLSARVAGRVSYRGEDMGQSGLAILDSDAADRLSAVLTDPRRRYAPSTTTKHLLSGLVRCGRTGCDGQPMFATTNGAAQIPVYRCRTCYGARRRDRVDEVVLNAVTARLSRPDAARLLDKDVDVTTLRETVVEIRERRDGLAALLADGLLTPGAVRVQAGRLSQQIDGLERQIDTATGDNPLADVMDSADISVALAALPLLKLRDVIRSLMEVTILPAGKGVRFTPEQVAINWVRA